MRIDPAATPTRDVYQTLISTILPRPIAWVTTVGLDGSTNLAPFSFFTGLAARPPTLAISIASKPDGGLKDTARNIIETRAFVVNTVPVALAEAMVLSSGDFSYGDSEIARAGVEIRPSERCAAGRIVGSPVQFECSLHQVVELEDRGRVTARLVLGRIELIHIDDGVLDAEGRIDARRLDPLARLGGSQYATLGDLLRYERPIV